MKIAIVGPGALGCLLAGFLKSKTKEDIWLLDNSESRAKKIRENGVRVETTTGLIMVKPNITTKPSEIGQTDLAILCVKSYSTEDACKEIKELVAKATYILTLQNGVGNIQTMNDHFGPEKVIAGVTNHGSTLLGDGHVRHAGKGDTIIGTADSKVLGAVRDVAHVLTKAGFDTKISKDIDSVIWSKIIINVGINALTAITRLNNGKLLEHEEAREVMRSAVQEAVKVVKRKRIKLTYDDPIQKVESVCKLTASNISSMLQDILSKNKTEIDFINGAIVRHAKALGIPTPVNETLTRLVNIIESTYSGAVTK